MTKENGIDTWAAARQQMANARENKNMSKNMTIVKVPGRIDTSGAFAAEARTQELVSADIRDKKFEYSQPPVGKDHYVEIDEKAGKVSSYTIPTNYVGEGRVELVAGGGKIFTDIAARFVRSERDISEIISSDYSPEIVRNIINSGHLAATEFDMFIFAVSGYSRVCETQLVRKRMASYLIKSGRQELGGKRRYDVVYPKAIEDAAVNVSMSRVTGMAMGLPGEITLRITPQTLNQLIKDWYEGALATGKYKEQDLRYMKPQATMWQGIIGMNAHSLIDISRIRMCKNAQTEIRDLVTKMVNLAKEVAPDLMETAGPSCKALGYCPEGRLQNKACQGLIPTKADALRYIEKGWDEEHSGCFKQDPETGEWVKAEPLKYTPGLIEKIAMLFRKRK